CLSLYGYNWYVTPLMTIVQMDPTYRPSLASNENGAGVPPFSGSDLVLSPSQWSSHVVGKISSWIDLDSEDQVLRMDSEITLKQEIAWASHLSLQACLLPPPRGASCANYARCVNQILQGLNKCSCGLGCHWRSLIMMLWRVTQTIWSSLPSGNSLGRWFGEPVKSAIIHTNVSISYCLLGAFTFWINTNPCIEKWLAYFATTYHSFLQIVISGGPVHNTSTENVPTNYIDGKFLKACSIFCLKMVIIEVLPRYIGHLYQRMIRFLNKNGLSLVTGTFYNLHCRTFYFSYDVVFSSRIQPLMDNLEAQTYETFEKDVVKYSQYQRAVSKALMDRVPDEDACTTTTVLMVVGAGRGPLVRASLQAAEETGRKLKVYAVEKNPNAVVTLHSLVKLEGWENTVTIVSSDMRCWDAPEKADILVSELLGSFGDNELSPECLDGAQRFLKDNGISIPSSYTSFLQPVTASKLYNDVKSHNDLVQFETAYVVKLHSVAKLSPSQPVFTFSHPEHSTKKSNQRYKKLRFEIPSDTGSAMVHGFAGYFDATLYKDVHLGIEPSIATPNMFSWFAIFFPLRTPICVRPDSPLEVHFWRCCSSTKVWYEWCVTSPSSSAIHNCNGRSYWVGL
ncbi:hypothetical protein GIB67_024025, partial [Kingdonia uniflora]